jgi:hypothetical protein
MFEFLSHLEASASIPTYKELMSILGPPPKETNSLGPVITHQ